MPKKSPAKLEVRVAVATIGIVETNRPFDVFATEFGDNSILAQVNR